MTSYFTVKLPRSLIKQIDAVLEQQNLGYVSRAELVKDAVRDLLAKIKLENPDVSLVPDVERGEGKLNCPKIVQKIEQKRENCVAFP